ncbi:hypothetical protein KFE94_16535 [bacterium SCSIO 12643]|nr:hypothetical protein KFE94_16535 [bacterium SCSIO 12643]
MVNKKAQDLIQKMQQSISDNGIVIEEMVNDLKELRTYAVAEKIPRLAKAIRLTYEHIEEYEGFFIPQPEDEMVDEDGEVIGVIEAANETDTDSLVYLLSIMSDAHNKMNHAELKEYNLALKDYAENN